MAARKIPIFAIAARSMLPVRPSDISVAIWPILSGPMMVITALRAARIRAAIMMPMLERIYPVILGMAEPTPLFLLFRFILILLMRVLLH